MAQLGKKDLLVEEFTHPPVKIEPTETIDDDNGRNETVEATCWGEKLGEIFWMPDEQWKLVCVHCYQEFDQFDKFVVHVQQHLYQTHQDSLEFQPKTEPIEDDCYEVNIPEELNFLTEDDYLGEERFEEAEASDINYDHSQYFDVSNGTSENHTNAQVKGYRGKEYTCVDCGKRFNRFSNLKRHAMQMHKKDYIYPCKQCDMGFTFKHLLRKHLEKVHTLRKPKIKFMHPVAVQEIGASPPPPPPPKPSVKYNIEIDIDLDKIYVCPDCGRRFNKLSNLKRHVFAIHNKNDDTLRLKKKGTGSKIQVPKGAKVPKRSKTMSGTATKTKQRRRRGIVNSENFDCPVCQSKFSRFSNMKRHLRAHENEPFFNCTKCSTEFFDLHVFMNHFNKKHADNIPPNSQTNDIQLSSNDEINETYSNGSVGANAGYF